MNFTSILTYLVIISGTFHFLCVCVYPDFYLLSLFLYLNDFFNIFIVQVCLWWMLLPFVCLQQDFSLFVEVTFIGYKILIWQVSFPSCSGKLHCLLTCIVSDEKSTVIFIFSLLYLICFPPVLGILIMSSDLGF